MSRSLHSEMEEAVRDATAALQIPMAANILASARLMPGLETFARTQPALDDRIRDIARFLDPARPIREAMAAQFSGLSAFAATWSVQAALRQQRIADLIRPLTIPDFSVMSTLRKLGDPFASLNERIAPRIDHLFESIHNQIATAQRTAELFRLGQPAAAGLRHCEAIETMLATAKSLAEMYGAEDSLPYLEVGSHISPDDEEEIRDAASTALVEIETEDDRLQDRLARLETSTAIFLELSATNLRRAEQSKARSQRYLWIMIAAHLLRVAYDLSVEIAGWAVTSHLDQAQLGTPEPEGTVSHPTQSVETLTASSPEQLRLRGLHQITRRIAPILAHPHQGADRVGVLQLGQLVHVLEITQGWSRVGCAREGEAAMEGWVRSRALMPTDTQEDGQPSNGS